MPTCEGCGGHVTEKYVRVCVPDDRDAPRSCPNCSDELSEGKKNLSVFARGSP